MSLAAAGIARGVGRRTTTEAVAATAARAVPELLAEQVVGVPPVPRSPDPGNGVVVTRRPSPVAPLVGKGAAYSLYAVVLWLLVPLAVFPLTIAAIYNASGRRYIPNVEYFFVARVVVGIFMNRMGRRYGNKLNGASTGEGGGVHANVSPDLQHAPRAGDRVRHGRERSEGRRGCAEEGVYAWLVRNTKAIAIWHALAGRMRHMKGGILERIFAQVDVGVAVDVVNGGYKRDDVLGGLEYEDEWGEEEDGDEGWFDFDEECFSHRK